LGRRRGGVRRNELKKGRTKNHRKPKNLSCNGEKEAGKTAPQTTYCRKNN